MGSNGINNGGFMAFNGINNGGLKGFNGIKLDSMGLIMGLRMVVYWHLMAFNGLIEKRGERTTPKRKVS